MYHRFTLILAALFLALVTCGASPAPTHQLRVVVRHDATHLPLDGHGVPMVHTIPVADLFVTCQLEAGCTLTISTRELAEASSRTPIPVLVALVHPGQRPEAEDFQAAGRSWMMARFDRPVSFRRTLYIRYVSAAIQAPGNYSGGLRVQLRDN